MSGEHSYTDAQLEAAAFNLYAAGPWGEFAGFRDAGTRVATDAHDMATYRAIVREVVRVLASGETGSPGYRGEGDT